MRPSAYAKSLPLAAAAALFLVAGCNRDGVKVYKVDPSDSLAPPPPPVEAMDLLLGKLKKTRSNIEFLLSMGGM